MTSRRSGDTRIRDILNAGRLLDRISTNKSGGQANRRANASQGGKNMKQKGGASELVFLEDVLQNMMRDPKRFQKKIDMIREVYNNDQNIDSVINNLLIYLDRLNIICDIFFDDKGVKRKFSNIRKTGGQIEISLPWTLRLPDVKQKMNGDSFWEVGDDNVYVHVPYWNPIYLFPRNTSLGWCDDFYIVIDGLTASDFEVGKDNVIKSVTIPSNVTIENGQDSYNTRLKTELDFFKTNGLIVIRDKLRPRPKIPSKDKQRQTSVS